MAGIGAPIRPDLRPAAAMLQRRLRQGCSVFALIAGLAALSARPDSARADGVKFVGMRAVAVDSSGQAASVRTSGGAGGSTSTVDQALARAASAGSGQAVFSGMRLDQVVEGANNPVVDATNNLMTIEQVWSKAIISWNQFDIAGGETVRFDQHGNSDWAVLNRIGGNDPSEINGALQADRHIYLINRNGVIFGNGARVNVRNLIASLEISDDQFRRGILDGRKDPLDTQADVVYFDGSGYTPGQIRVENGAVIEGPENASVILLGRDVVNDG